MDQYKAARAEADHLAALMRAALIRVGVPEAEVSRVRGFVTGSGRAYIELGALRVESAVRLREALPLDRDSTLAAPTPPAGTPG
ncbi:hypothetical protein ACIQNU_41455 [Streptomyces sp. NPDC091292]|uniref:hypothetical protein n=1 Tax=Streptomyces sp. NPDC091292 TaxID=3365991 RepID=UPI00382A3EE0